MNDFRELSDADMAKLARRAGVVLIVVTVLAIALLAVGCATYPTSEPCPPPPAPVSYPVPVFQPCEPPPVIPAPSDRISEVPGVVRELAALSPEERAARFAAEPGLLDQVLDSIIYAVLGDLDSCRSAWKRANDMLNIYRQRAGVPMLTTAAPLPTP